MSIERIFEITWIDPWFLHNMKEIIDFESGISKRAGRCRTNESQADLIRQAKYLGFSDKQLCGYFKMDEYKFRAFRKKLGIAPVYKLVDTCGAEFVAYTPYYYSTYERENEGRG